METIATEIELIRNLNQVEKYLYEGNQEEKDFALSLIMRGRCFIAYYKRDEILFAPSRFIGYKENSLTSHVNNPDKDGRITNPNISKLLKIPLLPDEHIENEYLSFCHSLGITPNNVPRKYWKYEEYDKSQ